MSRLRPAWGPEASTLPVRVTYRVKGQQAVTTRTMPHKEYFEWVQASQSPLSVYELVHAEQVKVEA